MKKIIYLTIINCSLLIFNSKAQTPLPTSYDFENFAGQASLPAGWNTNIDGVFTYQVGVTGVAGKIDLEGEYIQVFTADPMGAITFYLKAWLGNVSSWSGTFKVQESINGTTWTDLASYTTLNKDAYDLYTLTPASASRYVRWYFDTKVSGCNVGIDDIAIPLGQIITPEIQVEQNSVVLFDGGTSQAFGSAVGSPVNADFTIRNLSVAQNLTLSGATFSGPNAGAYLATTVPSSIAPGATGTLTVQFIPSVSGSLPATMTIANNDPDEGSYTLNLYGVGGTLASEPTVQATNLSFNNVKAYRYAVSFNQASTQPDGGYLVLRKTGSAVADMPADGASYTKGDYIGSSQVVYVGAGNSFVPKFNVASTAYHFAVYTFNGDGTYTNYNTTSPLTGSVTTTGANPGTYYSTINPTTPTFLTDLKNKIYTHTSLFYGNYEQTMVRLFESRDTTGGESVITCVYSGENKVYTGSLSWTTDNFSREHTYCQSWMPSYPAGTSGPNGGELPEYNDQHHLFPTNQNQANAVRSNNALGKVVTVTSTYLGAKYGKDANGINVYEPRDSHKGDAARAMFYMCAAYNGQSGNAWDLNVVLMPSGNALVQDQNILRQWHFQDPPDAWEIARNEFLDSLQGNRNPFIDNPDWVCNINFSNMTYIANPTAAPCESSGIENQNIQSTDISVYPNPAKDFLNVSLNANTNQALSISIQDISGKVVFSEKYKAAAGNNQYPLNISSLAKGNYFVKIVSADGVGVRKIVKE